MAKKTCVLVACASGELAEMARESPAGGKSLAALAFFSNGYGARTRARKGPARIPSAYI